MNILVTGGSGFIGSILCQRLLEHGHLVVILTRQPKKIIKPLIGIHSLSELSEQHLFDVVINLAGEPIAAKRWSTLQKEQIINSRIDTTRELINYLKSTTYKPQVLISGSAIGYYGINDSFEPINEFSTGDNSFSSELCRLWETEAFNAQKLGIRTCVLRTGIVLGKDGGALSKMLTPFRFGLGGKIGSGKQWMPWVHIEDLIGIILFCINTKYIDGPINCTAPNPVTNLEFTQNLGSLLKRPTYLTMPKTIVKLLMGQMGSELLLAGKKVIPQKIIAAGYNFSYENINDALTSLLNVTTQKHIAKQQ
jgi:uncharacterized protein (TIGR01777 family)